MSAEDLEKYETEMELQLYREYRDIVRQFSYVVETERRFYLANQVDLHVRNSDGEVYFVNSVIDRNTRSSEVKGFLTKAPPTVKAGMFAVIEIVLDVRKGALTVPEGAIFVDQRGPQLVTVVNEADGKVAAFVPVRLGLRTRGVVEVSAVKGELAEKQEVVAAGVGARSGSAGPPPG